ncbi:MAG: hypothetical protein NT167_02105 [Verrucomicrobia bacterium]|nr:hypothetical protein [Verrucomicrobiota bacterium]
MMVRKGNGAFSAFGRRLGLGDDCRNFLVEFRLIVGLLPQADEDALARQWLLGVPNTLGVFLVVEHGDLDHEVFQRWQPAEPGTLVRPFQSAIAGEGAPDGSGGGWDPMEVQLQGELPGMVANFQSLQHLVAVVGFGSRRHPGQFLTAPEPEQVDGFEAVDPVPTLGFAMSPPRQPLHIGQVLPGAHDLDQRGAPVSLLGALAL